MNDDVQTLTDLPADVRVDLLTGDPEPAFQILPPLEERDLDELRESVAERGIRVPVEVDPRGRVLDGHHRLDVARELELSPDEIPVVVRSGLEDEDDVLEYVLELNLGRRHLTREQRRKIVGRLRERGWSLRRIADRLDVSVGTAHGDAEAFKSEHPDGGDGPDTVEGRDGKQYPASRRGGPSPDESEGRPPAHAQGRGAGERRRSGRGRRADGPGADDAGDGASAPDAGEDADGGDDDPSFLEELHTASAALDRAIKLAPDAEAEERVREVAEDVVDVVVDVAGDGEAWVLPT